MRAIGSSICVMTADGYAILCDPHSLNDVCRPKKLHNMPLTSCAVVQDGRVLVTASTDYSYKFTAVSDFSLAAMLKAWLWQFALFLLTLLFLVDYIY